MELDDTKEIENSVKVNTKIIFILKDKKYCPIGKTYCIGGNEISAENPGINYEKAMQIFIM